MQVENAPAGACFAVQALAPAFGAFPVPLVGIGMSPVLGFWLGAGALAAARRSTRAGPAADASPPGRGSTTIG